MRRSSHSSVTQPAWRIFAIAVLVCSGLSLGACRSRSRAVLQSSDVPVEAGTVQASMPVDSQPPTTSATTPTPNAGAVAAPGAGTSGISASTPQAPQTSQGNAKKAPVGIWPQKVGSFSTSFKGPVWYPKHIPAGFKIDSLDVVEFDPGSGLVCDIVYLNGDKVVQFTQGSPKTRDYEIVSVGKVPWGTETADVVHEDPTDKTTPIVIVYSKGGNFAELTGDVSDAELKAIAASMVAVK